MLSIQLKDLSFHAFHGLYEEEKVLGNAFVVNLHVHYMPKPEVVTQLEETINYEALFALVQRRMTQTTPLLETVVMEMCYAVMEMFKEVQAVFVSLEKKNPPIENFDGGVVVSFQLERE